MKLTVGSYLKKQEEIKKLEEIIKDVKLMVSDYESLKKNKKYKKLKKDLELYKEQLKIIEERVGKRKIGQEIIEKSIDKHFPWMREARKKLFSDKEQNKQN